MAQDDVTFLPESDNIGYKGPTITLQQMAWDKTKAPQFSDVISLAYCTSHIQGCRYMATTYVINCSSTICTNEF